MPSLPQHKYRFYNKWSQWSPNKNFNCNSSINIIYAISCNLCPKTIYIGETSNSIRQRMNGHRSDIKHNRNKPVAEHFNNHKLKNIRLTVIKKVKGKTKQREVEEQKIILKFDRVNKSLNRDYSFHVFCLFP